MALRTISPLNNRDWKILAKDLKKGQTDEQAEFMRKAIVHARSLNVSYED